MIMTMKKDLIITMLLFILFACCTRDENNCVKRNFILAGENNNCMKYKSFNPPLQVNLNSSSVSIDIDGDQKNDLRFNVRLDSWIRSLVYIENKNIDLNFSSINYQVQWYSSDTNRIVFAGTLKGFKRNDTIRNSSSWSTQSDSIFKTGTIKFRVPGEIEFRPTYIGLRLIDNVDTVYGWLHIEGGYIYDYAYQVK
jgi:hypothetical protein